MSPSSLPIAVDPVALVTAECITVTSAMRKHARWAHSSVTAILGSVAASRVHNHDSYASFRSRDGGTPARPRSPLSSADDDHALANRWGLRGTKGKSIQDTHLVAAFTRLRNDLKDCKDIKSFDAPALLHPFLQVVRSSSASAAITSLALLALTKIFSYKIVDRDSPRIAKAMQLLSAAITHCRFEASDSTADEIVLLRILKLMEGMLSWPEGNLLGDESVCEMMETGLSMCCQVRLSEVLRRSAEIAMVNMVRLLFSRLSGLDTSSEPIDPKDKYRTHSDAGMPTRLKMDPSVDGKTVASQHPSAMGSDTAVADRDQSSYDTSSEDILDSSAVVAPPNPDDDAGAEVIPYSLASARELFRVLIDLLDPHNRQHTDSMRKIALRLINVTLEVAGHLISKHPGLASLAQNDLCRHLFQLVRSESPTILIISLRVSGTLLLTCRPILKLQQELYLSYLVACLHPRMDIPREPGIDPTLYEGIPQAPKAVKPPPSDSGSRRSTPLAVKDRKIFGLDGGSRKPETQEAMVESIGMLSRIPSFMVELFVNYDCEVDRANLCEDMIGLLSRTALPDSATWSTTNVPLLCLDALLSYVQTIYDRLDDQALTEGFLSSERLRNQRKMKRAVVHGAQKFNEDPKDGIAYLASHGIIENPGDPTQVAQFLKGTTRLSKKVLGEYISKRANESLLNALVDLLDFSGKFVVDALRDLLGAFRLPGEAPLIERIVTTFSDKYIKKAQPSEVADKDSLFVLTYAIIMLNTTLYNPNMKAQDRMSCTDFSKNLRGLNAGQDFAPEFLERIYDSIKRNEIILPDEHDNKQAFDFAWKELLAKSASAGKLVVGQTNIYDADMFAATWKPIVATLSYVFMSASDDAVYSRVVMGFDQCAQIAARYGLTEAFDRIIFSLSSISTLATNRHPNTAPNTVIQSGNKSIMVSELAVKFGRDFRAQLATVVLFRVLANNESKVRQSWTHIIQILRNLFINSLIPPFDSNLSADFDISPIPLQTPSQFMDRDGRQNETGLLSAVTSYISSYAADDPPEPSDEEIDNTLCTMDCVSACSIDGLLSNIRALPLEIVTMIVEPLLAHLHEENAPAVIVVKLEQPIPSTRVTAKSDTSRGQYDPGIIYLLDLAAVLNLRDQQTIGSLGKGLLAYLQTLSRVTYYLLNLLRLSHNQPFMRVPIILQSISSFDQDTLESVAVQTIKGLSRCVFDSNLLGNEITASPDFWSILQRLHQNKEAAPLVFSLLETIVDLRPPIVTTVNYEFAVSLANNFISAGNVGYIEERHNDTLARRSKAVSRGVTAIGLIYHLTGQAPTLIKQSHLEDEEAWSAYWSPIFHSLTSQCISPCRHIRYHAVSALQMSLLSVDIGSDKEWTAIFDQILFPLILLLLKPEVFHSDPLGMSETRVQAVTLICKIFLRYLDQLPYADDMPELWLKILDILDRIINSGQKDNSASEEAISESVKNIILVMADAGHLVPPSQAPSNEDLWTETRKRLERFLPDLFKEIFPDAPKELIPLASASGSPTTATTTVPEVTPTNENETKTTASEAAEPET
ncbi:hypothetical protein BDV12DRAFT_208274 [Aspergillus spectabilis]